MATVEAEKEVAGPEMGLLEWRLILIEKGRARRAGFDIR